MHARDELGGESVAGTFSRSTVTSVVVAIVVIVVGGGSAFYLASRDGSAAGVAITAPVTSSTVEVARPGSQLTTVPTAPSRTLASLGLPADVDSVRLEVAFDVYGWAPNAAGGARQLAVNVVSSKVSDLGPPPQDLSGANAVFSLALYKGAPIDEGGRFVGTLDVRASDGGRGAMFLLGARPVR